ncbi:MAG: hypothetical protein HY537_05185 [Deltaproteobacteria bacterium]|nr:hypothetical protein [Deltaproteobacteria bacterium]
MNLLDKNICLSLWKWKLLSTAALTEMYFEHLAPCTAYKRLWSLKRGGLIQHVPVDWKKIDRRFLWALTRKGFNSIREFLPKLRNDAFRSETIDHDHLVSAIHIGEWLKGIPAGCALFSEQQLRCLYRDQYPDWVPNVDIHRPDGYWRTLVNGKRATVALEVELTRKSGPDYRGIGLFYSKRDKLFRVIWVVKTIATATHIQKEIRIVDSENYLIHDFILLTHFLEESWGAKIVMGRDEGLPMAALFCPREEKSRKYISSTFLLNTLKSPHMSKSCAFSSKIKTSEGVGSSTLLSPSPNESSVRPATNKPLNQTSNTKGAWFED